MFNVILPMHKLFSLTLASFLIFLMIRKLFIKQPAFIISYYSIIFCILFFTFLIGGQVVNDGQIRFEQFLSLENNKIDRAGQNSHVSHLDSTLKIDLQSFKNSSEFQAYLIKISGWVDKAEAVAIGWVLFLLTDLSLALITLINTEISKMKEREIR